MQPQTLPTPGYSQYPQGTPQPPRSHIARFIVWPFLVFLVAGLVGGGYWLWQTIDSLNRANATLTEQLAAAQNKNVAATDDSQTVSFGESKVPFTFAYPSSWILASDATILYDKDLPVSYSITLSAPGTINTQTPDAGSITTDGAVINIAVLPAAANNVKDLIPKLPNMPAPTTTDVTVSGVPGIQYQFGTADAKKVYTDIIKNKVSYRLTFEAKGNLTANEHYGAYTALIKSFKLK